MDRNAGILLLTSAAAVVTAAGVWYSFRNRITPAEQERRRRLAVNRIGRMVDAEIVDVQEETIYYSYSIRGVEYTAAQDLSTLREFVTENPAKIVGPVTVKYAPQNPADSIVCCEEWSGLRMN